MDISQSIGLSCVAGDLGRYQKYVLKPTDIAKLKTALLLIWNDLTEEFTLKIKFWYL